MRFNHHATTWCRLLEECLYWCRAAVDSNPEVGMPPTDGELLHRICRRHRVELTPDAEQIIILYSKQRRSWRD